MLKGSYCEAGSGLTMYGSSQIYLLSANEECENTSHFGWVTNGLELDGIGDSAKDDCENTSDSG